MKRQWLGLVVGQEGLYGVQCSKRKESVQVQDAYYWPRKNSIAKDCKDFLHRYSLEDTYLSVAYEEEVPMTATVIPHMKPWEVREMLQCQVEDLFPHDTATYTYDFSVTALLEPELENKKEDLLFLVCMRRDVLKELTKGLESGEGLLKFVSFWPSVLYHDPVYKEGVYLVCYERGTSLYMYALMKGLCLWHTEIRGSNRNEAIQEAFNEIETMCTHVRKPGIEGVQYWSVDIGQEEPAWWQFWKEKYGQAQGLSLQVASKAQSICQLNQLQWQVAIRLALQGMNRSDYVHIY